MKTNYQACKDTKNIMAYKEEKQSIKTNPELIQMSESTDKAIKQT